MILIGQNLIIKEKFSDEKYIFFDNVIKNYSGSSDVKNEKIKKLNSKYFLENEFECDSNGVKAMSYMLDEEVWKGFKNINLSDYTVGGPSKELLEMAFSGISGKGYNSNFRVNKFGYSDNAVMYPPSYEAIEEYKYLYGNDYFLSTASNGALSNQVGEEPDELYYFDCYDGYPTSFKIISDDDYRQGGPGFRPIVCLKSDVKLVEEANGTLSISK